MSDKTELAGLDAVDSAELTWGFDALFWSLLVFMMALTESLVLPVLRTFPVLLLGASALGAVAGAHRLHQVRTLGEQWRKRTRRLRIATIGVAYLSLFYLLWRRVPANGYLLIHALVFFGMVIVLFGLLCPPILSLTRAAGRQNLVVQCVLFSTMALLLLVPAYVLVAQMMLAAVRHGYDPFVVLQLWLAHTSVGTTLMVLLPVALMQSLLWTAKDLAREALLAKRTSAS